jgi:hypothetical protein
VPIKKWKLYRELIQRLEGTQAPVSPPLKASVAKQIGAEKSFICCNRGAATVFLDLHKNNFTNPDSHSKCFSGLKISKCLIV